MIRQSATLLAALSLAACLDGQNPLVNPGGGVESELPGTENPTRRTPIERYEKVDDNGNGFAQSISYDPVNDTFTVDNLAFDGGNTYQRGSTVSSLNGFRVYENDDPYFDDVTGTPIWQFLHRAIMTESASGNTRVAIVRTGAYIPYGFGGFNYAREIGVEIPSTGQAYFAGNYAGLRDFNGRSGLEYVTGNAEAAVDFEDFNRGDGVRFVIFNRQVLDINGIDITPSIVNAFNSANQTVLPNLYSKVGPGAMTAAGEVSFGMFSNYIDPNGDPQDHLLGSYYGVLAGEGADMELVGVIVVEGVDLRDDTRVRETGGFVMERQ